MKIFKNWKLGSAFLISFAFLLTLASGFSTWVFEGGGINLNDSDTEEIKPETNYIDKIKENYHFIENVYTIYFFPQNVSEEKPYDPNTKAPKVTPIKNNEYGYWKDVNGDGRYGYKKLTVTLNPTSEQLKSIGDPQINKRDVNLYPLKFMGWSADLQNSINFTKTEVNVTYDAGGGLPRSETISKLPFTTLFNNDYKYADLTKSLENLDGGADGTLKVTDGTQAKDKVIFLYPVFTTGKNYATANNGYFSQDQAIVRLESRAEHLDTEINKTYPEKTYYFEQKWGNYSGPYNNDPTRGPFNYSNSYYSYTGLRVEQGDQYYLSMEIPGRNKNTGQYYWIGKWRTLNWESAQVDNRTDIDAIPKNFINAPLVDSERFPGSNHDGPFFIDAEASVDRDTYTSASKTFLKPGPGTYNIYVYINWNQEGKTTPAPTPNTMTEFNNDLSPDNTVFLKTARYVRTFNKNQAGVFGTVDGLDNYAATVFVKVQKVEEPRLLSWENSNNFTNLDGGIRMLPLAKTLGSGTADSQVQKFNTHGNLLRAIDYYAFNVPVRGKGSKHYILDEADEDKDIWINDRYMAFTTQSAAVNDTSNYITPPFAGHYFETPNTTDTSQINNYSIVTGKADFQPPAGPNFGGNNAMETEKKVRFSAPNIKTLTTTVGGIQGSGTEISKGTFANKYNYRNFFSPNILQAADNQPYYYDDSEYHFVLRLYYAYEQNGGGFNTSYVYGYTVFAIPRKIRKFNAIYFINSKDVNNFETVPGGLIDMEKTLPKLTSTYYTTELYSKYNDKGSPTEIPASSLLLYANGTTNAGSVDQLIRKGTINKPRNYLDEKKEYDVNTVFSFDTVQIVLFDA